ncbi:DUF262 domain-containing protein [bacterium]|nr:DUF262 domain-containing protein [bacterium]
MAGVWDWRGESEDVRFLLLLTKCFGDYIFNVPNLNPNSTKFNSMQDYLRYSISEIVEKINRIFFLPDIQRDFVWKPEQVYALFDSIMRDYPISTMLFWIQDGKFLQEEKIKKLEFVSKSSEKNNENKEIDSAKEYQLVLDGQQRLTTFYLVLKGNYIIRNRPYDLYFNVLSGGTEQDDGILYEFRFFNEKNGKAFLETNKKAGTKKLWYGVKNVYDIPDIDDIDDVLEKELEQPHAIKLNKDQKKGCRKLVRLLKYEKILYYYPEKEKDYDKVLDIFVRTNSGGTKLSYSDLLFSTIKSKWVEARTKFEYLLNNINEDRYKFDTDFLLKSALLIYSTNLDQVRYKSKNFRTDLLENLKRDWEKSIEPSIALLVDILKDRLFLLDDKLITSYNALIPIIYWIFKNDFKAFGTAQNFIRDEDVSKLGTWLVKSLLTGVFGGQSDTILYKCKEAIDLTKSSSFPAKEIEEKIESETKRKMILDFDDFDKYLHGSYESHLILTVCYNGAINFRPKFKGNLPEQDHIFSQDELLKNKVPPYKINSLYNLRYIGSTENKTKSNLPFSEWIVTVKSPDEWKKHLIPKGSWSIENFDEFLNARKEEMKKAFTY